MAKGKSANPADAFRKAQRKKELKKNKTERSKARDFALVKKDTKDLEDEIVQLEANADGNKSRLEELKAELEKINKKKEEYVAEHPEHRKLVYRQRRDPKERVQEDEVPKPQTRNLFKKNGLPRYPERSIYYDPKFNPFGVPPPGMPYMEKPLNPEEMQKYPVNEDDDDDDDDDIVLPPGPPPGVGQEEDSDDDIPLPDGPPPGKTAFQPPLPPSPYPPYLPVPPMQPPSLPIGVPPPPLGAPPLPFGFGMPPPPPPLLPPGMPMAYNAQVPPPPPGFVQHSMPPPPPGFFPRRAQSVGSMQDPLSSIPHQTFQAHKTEKTLVAHPSLPPKPMASTVMASSSAAVVSAEPELRDFKKEATSFVPTALKRKRGNVSTPTSKVNAAPSVDSAADTERTDAPRPDLMGMLRSQLGPGVGPPSSSEKVSTQTAQKPKDDYEKFLEEMGDMLEPKP